MIVNILVFLAFAGTAQANCSSPSGAESQTHFDAGILYYCNGTDWIRMDSPPGVAALGYVVGDLVMDNGAFATFYSATSHTDCASIAQSRTCTNGVLSGSFPHATCTDDPCSTGSIGTVCTGDGAYYIGDIGGIRIYARATDSSTGGQWRVADSATAGTDSETDGPANTTAMIAAAASHPVAELCRSHGPEWYVPAKDELNLIWQHSTYSGGLLDLAVLGISIDPNDYYWSSTQHSFVDRAWIQRFSNGNQVGGYKANSTRRARCVRR